MKTETCTATLGHDAGGWYANTQLTGKVYLAASIQHKPDQETCIGASVCVTLQGAGPAWVVVDYHF